MRSCSAVFRSQMLPFTLPREFVGFASCLHTLCIHLPRRLIDTQFSRKGTLMFQDVLLFELFHKNIPNPLLFSSKISSEISSRPNIPVRKKAYCNCLKGRQTPSKLVTAVLNLSNPDIQHHFGSISKQIISGS